MMIVYEVCEKTGTTFQSLYRFKTKEAAMNKALILPKWHRNVVILTVKEFENGDYNILEKDFISAETQKGQPPIRKGRP
jgi:hypothetical protein